MIHTIEIDNQIDLTSLRKEFRKRLMTGGAIIRIRESASSDELQEMASKFVLREHGKPIGVPLLVAQELLRAKNLPEHIRQEVIARGVVPDTRVRDRALETLLSSLDEQSLRCFFLSALGDGDEQVKKRRALAQCARLPGDLLFLLGRDPNQTVRFHLKFTETV